MTLSLFATDPKTAWADVDGPYRYTLGRRWSDGPRLLYLGHNPSTAKADEEDPTSRRFVGFAKAWGFGSYVTVNFAAAIATNKRDLWKLNEPFGPENHHYICKEAAQAQKIVVCCGSPGSWKYGAEEARAVIAMLRKEYDLYGVGDPDAPKSKHEWDPVKNKWVRQRGDPSAKPTTIRAIETSDCFPVHLLYQPSRLVPVLWKGKIDA